jgi:SAM-dependent methyltransferase
VKIREDLWLLPAEPTRGYSPQISRHQIHRGRQRRSKNEDVIISNCVINLSDDKDLVLKEAFRVLKPGGRLAISDVVLRGNVAAEIKKNVELRVGCVAGALTRLSLLAANFTNF